MTRLWLVSAREGAVVVGGHGRIDQQRAGRADHAAVGASTPMTTSTYSARIRIAGACLR